MAKIPKMCRISLSCGCEKLVQREIAQHVQVGAKTYCVRHGEVEVAFVEK